MAHVQATDISLAYGDRDILSDVTITLSSGDRCALAGANGSGKSTLLKILAGMIEPDSGSIVTSSGISIAYLPQSGIAHSGKSLLEEVEEAFKEARDLIRAQQNAAQRLSALGEDEGELHDLLHHHDELHEAVLRSGYYDRESRIDRVLTGLGFRRTDFDRKTDEFSGGWQMRIALAKVLLRNPDMLLLDEPTNYLDLEARVWLSSFLSEYSGGALLVSHDRRFLDQTINYVWELFLADIKRYRGTYTSYEAQREEQIERIKQAYAQQQEEIKRLEDFIKRFRATASKAKQVQSRVKQLEKMELIELPEHLKKLNVTFPPAPRSGDQVVVLEGVGRCYGANCVIDDVDLTISRGERLVLVGPNGAGKSTLMRIIAEQDTEFVGSVNYGAGVARGFYADDDNWLVSKAADSPAGGPSVIDALSAVAVNQNDQQVRDLLGAFLFRGDDIYKSVSVLSGGERSRLALLRLLLQPLNLLVLDEPTNHLDLASKEVLLGALDQFGGTIVLVSHDRDFVEKTATRVVELRPAGVRPDTPSLVTDFPGEYSYYAWRVEQRESEEDDSQRNSVGNQVGGSEKTISDERLKQSARVLSHDEQKARRSRIQKLERLLDERLLQIEKLDRRSTILHEELARPDVYGDGVAVKARTEELAQIDRAVQRLTEEWETASAEHEELLSVHE